LLFLALTEKTVKHLDFDELVVAKLYGRRVATYQIKMPVSLKKSFLSNSSPYREKRVSKKLALSSSHPSPFHVST
jgi:hypothetical protein